MGLFFSSPPRRDGSPIQFILGVVIPAVKRPWREADHSSLSSPEVKNAWSCTSAPQYVFIVWCLIKGCLFMAWYLVKHSENFTFFLLYLYDAYRDHDTN
jgi:hypothetical protein